MAAFLQNADAPARGHASCADYFLARVLVPARGPENRFSKNAHCADLKNRPKTSAPPVRGISNPHTLCGFGIVLCPLKKTESQEKTKNKKTPPLRRALKARGAGRRGHLLDRRDLCTQIKSPYFFKRRFQCFFCLLNWLVSDLKLGASKCHGFSGCHKCASSHMQPGVAVYSLASSVAKSRMRRPRTLFAPA